MRFTFPSLFRRDQLSVFDLIALGAVAVLASLVAISLSARQAESAGPWQETSPLNTPRREHRLTTWNDYLYAVGGVNGSTTLNSVEFSRADLGDGGLSPWTTTASLPQPRQDPGVVAAEGYVYVLGGVNGNTSYSTVYKASINANGTLNAFEPTTPLPSVRHSVVVVEYESHLIAFGGHSGSSDYSTVWVSLIGASGVLGPWQSMPSMSSPRHESSGFVANGYVYAVGGSNPGFLNSTESARLEIDYSGNVSVGSWTPSTSMGIPRKAQEGNIAIVGHDLFYIGGESPRSQPLNMTSERTSILANGALASWTPTIQAPDGLVSLQAVGLGQYLYSVSGVEVSGSDPAHIPQVYVAAVAAPTVTPTVTGTIGDNDWYVSDVTIDWDVGVTGVRVANFSATWPTSHNFQPNGVINLVDLSYDLTNPSNQASSWLWDFGDGATSTAGPVVTHGYATSGRYDITLTTDFGTVSRLGYAVVYDNYGDPDALAVADFVAARCDTSFNCSSRGQVGTAPFAVEFDTLAYDNTSSSATITSWAWDFGDGVTSGAQHPEHTYAAPGIYTVSLTTSGTHTRTEVKDGYIVVLPPSSTLTTDGCDATLIDTDTPGVTLTCTATSAGGTASESVTIKRDATAPALSGVPMPAANAAGWNDTDVTVTFSCTDAMSGVDSIAPPVVLTSDGTNQSAAGDCTDLAGNSAGLTIDGINIDQTAPALSGVSAPPANLAGWNNTDVTVTFSCTDALSGVDSVTPPVVLTSEGINLSATGECTDVAGNSDSLTVDGLDIDKTAPVVTIASPLAFAVDPVGLPLDFSAVDALSGVDSLTATLDDGTALTAVVSGDVVALPGIYTLSVTGTDFAGNRSTESAMFVVYDPSAGFATGGGWITPGGASSDALDALPGLDGSSRATFGFVVKYKNGASTNPIGQLEFVYHVGSFNLHSTDYDWLVVTNSNWAKFQGTATIDGYEGLYSFRVDARDGDAVGGSLADRFVIKIWAPGDDPDTDEPVYKASGDLEGGKIKIHQ